MRKRELALGVLIGVGACVLIGAGVQPFEDEIIGRLTKLQDGLFDQGSSMTAPGGDSIERMLEEQSRLLNEIRNARTDDETARKIVELRESVTDLTRVVRVDIEPDVSETLRKTQDLERALDRPLAGQADRTVTRLESIERSLQRIENRLDSLERSLR